MRSALIVLWCVFTVGCAVVRDDAAEPVESRADREAKKAAPERASDVLKPDTNDIASPVNDDFFMRISYFKPSVTTEIQLNSNGNVREGTVLSAEDDLGLDDSLDQIRMEAGMRIHRYSLLRVDYFRMSRFQQQPLPRDIDFGDFQFDAGDMFRTKLDWRVFTITGTGQVNLERIDAGLGIGIHVIQVQAEGREVGTTRLEEASEVAIFPTIAANFTWRISKRWSTTLRGQMFSASPEDFSGKLSDYHFDLQYRWRKNFSVGIGYTMLETNFELIDTDQPLLFNMKTEGPELFIRAAF
jgi:hypothetical protein